MFDKRVARSIYRGALRIQRQGAMACSAAAAHRVTRADLRAFDATKDAGRQLDLGLRLLCRAQTQLVALDRCEERAERVRFRVGDVVIHARHGWACAVIGWSDSCEASEAWVSAAADSPLTLA